MSRAELVLSALVAYGTIAIGWRSWGQWRRTGSAGFRGVSGTPMSLEWWGGVLLAVAFIVAGVTPILVMLALTEPVALPQVATILGAAALGLGFVGTLAAQASMGDSWRIGVDETERTSLVSGGLFRLSRNPIFTSMLLVLAGLMLLLPCAWSAVAFVAGLLGIELQVRKVEEPYLLATHGRPYREYASEVGRFVPWLGRMTAVDAEDRTHRT